MKDLLAGVSTLIGQVGVVRTLFVVSFLGGLAGLSWLVRNMLNARDREIHRLADENKEYRERFVALLDKEFKIPKYKLPKRK